MASDSDYAQKIIQAEQRAIRNRKVNTPASFTKSSSCTISKAPSFQFPKWIFSVSPYKDKN